MKRLIRGALRRVGYEIRRIPKQVTTDPAAEAWAQVVRWRGQGRGTAADRFLRFALEHLNRSHGQLAQDILVVYLTGGRREGFFVEFGATNGVSLSNSLLLERDHGWRGILAEPARGWYAALVENRPGAVIDTRAVWSRTGERLVFNETPSKEVSTIDAFSSSDGHAAARAAGERYEVETVSLTDLLREHGAPAHIDYLSIDTEGSEFEVLAAHDWSAFRFGIITVEHNYTTMRERISELLTARGYRRIFGEFSLWDDWYVDAALYPQTTEARAA